MTLSTDLEAAAVAAGILERTVADQGLTIATQAAQIATLTQQLADAQNPTPPAPQPSDGHYVSLTDDVNAAIRSHPAGSTFALEPGPRTLTEPLVRKAGNRIWSDGTMFTGPGAGGVPFLPVDVNGLVLQGIGAKYFGPATTDQGSGMVDFEGGTDLLLEDCDFGYSNRSAVSGHISWQMVRTYLHHCGRYAAQGAFGLIQACEWSHSGRQDIAGVIGWTKDRNRGGAKFVKSDGMRIEGLYTHDHDGSGVHFDIQNINGYLKDVRSEFNARHGINLEVSYGPFEVVDAIIRNCGTSKGSGETDIPVPAGIVVTLTPDVLITNPTVEDCWNGIMVRQWAHPQSLPPGHPDRIGDTTRSLLGCENIIVNGGKVTRSKQFDAGLHGPYQSGLRPSKNIHYNGVTFDPDATFCSSLHIA